MSYSEGFAIVMACLGAVFLWWLLQEP